MVSTILNNGSGTATLAIVGATTNAFNGQILDNNNSGPGKVALAIMNGANETLISDVNGVPALASRTPSVVASPSATHPGPCAVIAATPSTEARPPSAATPPAPRTSSSPAPMTFSPPPVPSAAAKPHDQHRLRHGHDSVGHHRHGHQSPTRYPLDARSRRHLGPQDARPPAYRRRRYPIRLHRHHLVFRQQHRPARPVRCHRHRRPPERHRRLSGDQYRRRRLSLHQELRFRLPHRLPRRRR